MVIAYRYLFEMSEAETAEALDVRPGTVKSRLSRRSCGCARTGGDDPLDGGGGTRSDPMRAPTDEQLEAALAELAAPRSTASDAGRRGGGRTPGPRSKPRRRPRRRLAWSLPESPALAVVIAAALLALAGAALAARVVFELGAVVVEVLPGRPTALPTNAVATSADLGREVSPEEAEAIAGFPAALPPALGPPDRTWVDETEIAFDSDRVVRRVASAWSPTSDCRCSRAREGGPSDAVRGSWEVASKQLFAETNRFGEAIVDGRPAFWTTGEHELVLIAGGEPNEVLVTGNVLIWQDAGFTPRDRARRSTARSESPNPSSPSSTWAETGTPRPPTV